MSRSLHVSKRPFARASCALLLAVAMAAPLALATHADGSYDMPVFFPWEVAELDVLVVPPTHGELVKSPLLATLNADPAELDPYANSYMRAVLDSIADWEAGIAFHGPSWLSDGLVLNVYVLGRDEVPQEVLADPEIIVTTAEEQALVWAGVAAASTGDPTSPVDPLKETTCVISNTKFTIGRSWTYREMYSLNAHEFGHCLGLDHPGDVDPSTFHPTNDVMAYGPLSWTKCVSNLNVKGLELVYGPLFGEPGGTVATLPVDDYVQFDCAS